MNAGPTKAEVQQELDKLFASKEFEGTPVLRSLLEFIVGYSINGEEKSGKEIAVVVFPASDPDSTNVKANVFSIRDRLSSYFSGDGSKDLVRIELPIGRTYKAAFSYKYDAEAVRLYERGVALMGSAGHSGRSQAKTFFDLAISADENLAEAHLLRLQVTILDYLLAQVLAVGGHDGPPGISSHFEGQLTALKLNSRSWRMWCIYGAGRLVLGQVDIAGQAFENALDLDREKTEANIFYAFYLLFAGNREEALRLSRLWDKSSVDESLLIARGFFFYLAGEGAPAIEALHSFRAAGPEMKAINLLLQGLVNLKEDDEHWEFGQQRIFMASTYWSHIKGGGKEEPDYWTQLKGYYEERRVQHRAEGRFWLGYQFPDAFAGFNVLALAKIAPWYKSAIAEAEELLARLERSETSRPFQIAVACMALGRKEKAVEYLRKAISNGDALALHMDRWPFLQGLKDCPASDKLKQDLETGAV